MRVGCDFPIFGLQEVGAKRGYVLSRVFIGLASVFLSSGVLLAQAAEYMPGPKKLSKQWIAFYKGDHESDLPAPLIAAGRQMVPYICDAISHPDMRYRRYAISALGALRDKRAISQLVLLVENKDEVDYFRGDALEAIYQIDRKLALEICKKYSGETNYLKYSIGKIHKLESEGGNHKK